jgi:hypothetical protein
MATNVYDREEIISFNPTSPYHLYGWYISTSSGAFSVSGFCTRKLRDAFLAEVHRLLNEKQLKASSGYVGPLAFAVTMGEESEWAEGLLKREMADDLSELEVDDFCEAHLFPICEKYNDVNHEDGLRRLRSSDKSKVRDRGDRRSPKVTKASEE